MPRSRVDDVSAHLPLKPVDFHVLLVLLDGNRHGYGIVKDIEDATDGRLRLEPGNLYRYIRRLEERGLVEEDATPPDPESDDERRRYYRITRLGRRVIAAEAARLKAMVRRAESRIVLPDVESA